uniref:Uncharacterized protein n=1 Tax=Glossina austeni TaxID=7395 RepID=A0A1A9UE01_GLOAU
MIRQQYLQYMCKEKRILCRNPLRGRLFAKLCDDMVSKYRSLLYYCEARWFSRAKVLQRVFELKEEIAIFLSDNNRDEARLLYDTKFLVKLAYLVDIFQRLSILNKSMQGAQIHPFTQKAKITEFMKKLELWIISLKKNNFDMFPTFKITRLADEIEESKVLINNYLTSLWKQFSLYFKNRDVSKCEWIRNPFEPIEKYDYFGVTTAEQEMIIDLSSDSTLKQMFRD